MEDEYHDFLIELVESRIRDLRLKLDRSKHPIFEDDKLTTNEVTSIESEIKHWKIELKLYEMEQDF